MEDKNGIQIKWKTIKMEDDKIGCTFKNQLDKKLNLQNERPKWKMTKMEDDQKVGDGLVCGCNVWFCGFLRKKQ